MAGCHRVKKIRTRRVTDPAAMAEIVAKGKYRPHLPHHQKDGDGLLVEVKDVSRSVSRGES